MAPEQLQVGQNLFDQEPFSSLVRDICGSTGKTSSVVHTFMSLIAKEHFDQTRANPNPQTTTLLRKVYFSNSVKTKSEDIPWDYQEKILESLQMYPYLSEYIELHQQYKRYSRNGNPVQAKNYKPTPSYANWVTQKLQREKRLWLVGIEEIFPQDVGYPVTTQPNITGIKPGSRRYRILKAAELIK